LGEAKPEKKREFLYTDKDFRRVQKMIKKRVGIHLADNKDEMVYSRLARRLRATGIPSLAEYLDYLDDEDHGEWESFVNALTTNLTAFFRENHHFDTLKTHLQDRRVSRRPVRIWCCAASTGEEPYSIAMTVAEQLGMDFPVEIIASDVDTNALRTAAAGVYSMERIEKLDKGLLKKFFLKGTGKNAGKARVKPALRQKIQFRQVNLLDLSWPVEGPLDAIFCRNVFIYFQSETQQALLTRFHRLLADNALFFAGHSESLISSGDQFKSLGKTVFVPKPSYNKGQ
jgi:chemotaxis protein methyltransferase CheR